MANATDPNFRYIPEWFLGPDLTQIGVWPIQRQTDGTWNTLQGTLALAGTIDRIELIEEITHQVIKPVNRRQRNEVIVEDGWSLNIVEIQKTDPEMLNVLNQMVFFNQFVIQFAQGLEFYTGWFRRGALRTGVTDEGKNTVEMALRPMDVGFPNNVSLQFSAEVRPFIESLLPVV
jgi:hypothetical protein